MKEKVKQLRKKGFTLIELIVVIAVLGILVLLAAPKFLGYTAEAKLKHIQNDIKVYENSANAELTENPELENSWNELTKEEIDAINESNKALNKRGKRVSNLSDEDNYILNLPDVKSNLKGDFIWTSNDEVIYYDENLNGSLISEDDSNGGEPEDLPEFTPEEHFKWVEDSWNGYEVDGKGKGYYQYTGTGEETVIIPHVIDGHPMTSYYMMFYQSGADVKKVISTNPNITDMNGMFKYSQATSLDLSNFDTSNVTDMSWMFQDSQATSLDLSNFDTSNVINMRHMFSFSQATSLDLSNFNTSKVTDMGSMFQESQVKTIDLSNFDTSSVTNIDAMFYNSQATTFDLSSFDTSQVTTMYGVFYDSQATSLDLSSFDTSNVTEMREMFYKSQVTSLDLSNFVTSNVTDMSYMFAYSQVTSLDLSSFDTRNVTDMRGMFRGSQATSLNVSSFDTSKGPYMSSMFNSSQATSLDLRSFDTSKVTNMQEMFKNAQATSGYAGTQADADKLNNSLNKPTTLTFTVKQ